MFKKRLLVTLCKKILKYHVQRKFPSKESEKKLWLEKIKRENFYPSSTAVLCSDHFEASCFDRTGQTVRLKQNSLPTIFKFPAHLLTEKVTPTKPIQKDVMVTESCDGILTDILSVSANVSKSTNVPSVSVANVSNSNNVPSVSVANVSNSNNVSSVSANVSNSDSIPSVSTNVSNSDNVPSVSADVSNSNNIPSVSISNSNSDHQYADVSNSNNIPLVSVSNSNSDHQYADVSNSNNIPLVSVSNSNSDHQYAIADSPCKLKRQLEETIEKMKSLKKRLKHSQQVSRRAKKKCQYLSTLVEALQQKPLIFYNCA
ncbi:ABC transporter G family member 7 isoform X2 [Patella vulgata]|uniref:ABC transporter G family member 7 isoform X2 n=1 Tax=Patella vulgata TaxID=6465 RepID=UPI00217F99AC|nr:ABC transporter G family member 7 isoform X2 [Patella vulgata]